MALPLHFLTIVSRELVNLEHCVLGEKVSPTHFITFCLKQLLDTTFTGNASEVVQEQEGDRHYYSKFWQKIYPKGYKQVTDLHTK